MTAINRIVAEVRFITVYTCSVCGTQKVGDTKRVTFDGGSSAELKAFVDGQPQCSHQMPVGWGYDGKFTCGCTR